MTSLLRYDECGSQASPKAKGRCDEFQSSLSVDNSNGNDEVKEGSRTQGDFILSPLRVMQTWGWGWDNKKYNGGVDSLDVFTPRTKRRRKRELGWDTGSSSSTDDEMGHHTDERRRSSNVIQQHLDQLKPRQSKQRGSQASLPDKHSTLMCISEM